MTKATHQTQGFRDRYLPDMLRRCKKTADCANKVSASPAGSITISARNVPILCKLKWRFAMQRAHLRWQP